MRAFAALGTGLALLVFAGPASANDEAAGTAVKRINKTMTKLKSYQVAAQVQGGMAKGPEHKITQMRVNESYRSDVVGNLAHVQGRDEAFRVRMGAEGKGTIKSGAVWKGILSTPEGRQLERLFQRPEDHFATMTKHRKLAEWLPAAPADPAAPAPQVDFDDEVEAEDATAAKKTRVRKGKKSQARTSSDGPLSHRIRLVAPTTEAIEQFTTIVNSGCLGGG